MTIASPPSPDRLSASFAQGYGSRPTHAHDELLADDGTLRPHWQTFIAQLDELGISDFSQRWQEARQLIRENGVTYNVYGDPRGLDRPWELDPIPLIISAEESKNLEYGLIQRARLLETVLADLYGPQKLLQQGLIPPELVFANPGFLRACHGIAVPGNRYLHLVAFDLGRSPDGTIVVLGERTQGPSGAGYALENRLVLARMLPEIFAACKVQRLARFFRTLRDTLRGLAAHNRDNPRMVLLTPGPFNETYFEHAYLARYLGYTLAEGGDLTVRNQRVYLKFLDGLQPVDVIWRRLDDDYCDPLELRGDSFLGVPGLVQAVRAGNVAVANALGSSLTESPAFIPFLPALCRHLFDEELRIPSVPAYWCGDAAACSHVLARLSHMVIKGAFPSLRFDPIFPEKLSRDQQQHLIDRIRAKPWAYVGQDRLDLSTTPVFSDTRLQPRHVVVRVYLAAAAESFVLMPGGLTRVTASSDTMVVSLQKGGGSKDTWVLTDGEVDDFSLLRGGSQTMELSRSGNDLPSRAADNLYWLGRYVQRAEDMVRLLRGILVRLTEGAGLAEVPELPSLLRSLTQLTQTLPGFIGAGAATRLADPDDELFSLIYHPDRVGSLAYNFQSIHRSASSVRDRISMDMWRIVSSMSLQDLDADRQPTLSDALDLLNHRVITLAGFGGIAMESMTRGHGWRFLEMGRKIERAQHTIGLLRGSLITAEAYENSLLEALLEIADSSMTYRRRYGSGVQASPVLDLLLADDSNPRALLFQFLALRDVINQLPRVADRAGRSAEERLILSLVTRVQLVDVEQLALIHDSGKRDELDDFLKRLEQDLPLLSDAISHHYLSHLQMSRQLATGSAE